MSENRLPEELRKAIEEAAKASPDMNIPDNDDPADDADATSDEPAPGDEPV